MRRRKFVAALATAGLWPFAVHAQQPIARMIGFLGAASAAPWLPYVAAFRQGLREGGYVEGEQIAIDFRWAEGRYERLPALAAELVRRKVAVIVATGGAHSVRAAMGATKTIPIVFTIGTDPVEQGLVSSLGRPDRNATGVPLFTTELLMKRLELLHEIVPKAAKIAVLVNPLGPGGSVYPPQIEVAARVLARQIYAVNASSERELDAAFERVAQQRAAGLLVTSDVLFDGRRAQIAMLIARYAMPTMQSWREDVEAGGLMSYGPSLRDSYRQAGIYTAKILDGARPAQLPIQQPSKLEFVINLKTARAMGLTIPSSLLARADEVIE
jgi:putative ABC transport system substrate-binding protein